MLGIRTRENSQNLSGLPWGGEGVARQGFFGRPEVRVGVMRKLVPLVLGTLLLAAGCSSEFVPVPPTPVNSNEAPEQTDAVVEADEEVGDLEDLEGLEVEAGIYDVTVTIPNLLGEMELSQEEVDQVVEESGWVSGHLNDDGSTTYVIPSDLYEEYLDEMRLGIEDSIAELIADEPNIYKSITYNDTVTKFDVVVNRSEYEASFFPVAGFSLGLQGSFFQFFSGVQQENMNVDINYIDEETGEVFDTYGWPNDLGE